MEWAASIVHVVLAFPAWRPHFSFLSDPAANELMALRWLHFIFGIIWIGLLYFFNFVLTPSFMALNGGEHVSNGQLALSVGGGLGLMMMLNPWGVVWRGQKRLIVWMRGATEQGTPMPAEAERLMRWTFLASGTSLWLSFPMLFFMGASSHYPFLSSVAR